MAYDISAITDKMLEVGLPVVGVTLTMEGTVVVQWSEGVTPTPEQEAQAQAIIDSEFAQQRRPRTIHAIYADIKALPGPDKQAIWNDLHAGTPPKYFSDTGGNDSSIAVMHWNATYSGAPAAALQEAQLVMMALYTQDVPGYLRNPTFAPTVNISGDELVPEA